MNELFYLLGLYFCIGSLIYIVVPTNQLYDSKLARFILLQAKYIFQLPYGLFSLNPSISYLNTIPFSKQKEKAEAIIFENDFFQIYWHVKHAFKTTLTEHGNVTGLTSIRTSANFSLCKIFILEAWGHGGYTCKTLKVQISNPAKVPNNIALIVNPITSNMPKIFTPNFEFQSTITANKVLLPEFLTKINTTSISNIGNVKIKKIQPFIVMQEINN